MLTIIIRCLVYNSCQTCVGLVFIPVDSCQICVESCWLVLCACWFELDLFWFVLSRVGLELIRVDLCQNCVDCTGTRVLEYSWSFIYFSVTSAIYMFTFSSIFRYFLVSSTSLSLNLVFYFFIFFFHVTIDQKILIDLKPITPTRLVKHINLTRNFLLWLTD